jgi:hypothetical protein
MTIITQEGMEKALQQNYDNEDTEAEHEAQAVYIKEFLKTVLGDQVFKAPQDIPLGKSMRTAEKPLVEWIGDTQEELLDAIVYLEKVKEKISQ